MLETLIVYILLPVFVLTTFLYYQVDCSWLIEHDDDIKKRKKKTSKYIEGEGKEEEVGRGEELQRRHKQRQLACSETLFTGCYWDLIAALPSFLFGDPDAMESQRVTEFCTTIPADVRSGRCRHHGTRAENNNVSEEEIEEEGKNCSGCCSKQNVAPPAAKAVRSDKSQYELTMSEYLPSDNFTFIRCPPRVKLGDKVETEPTGCEATPPGGQGQRRLLVLFAWLFAKGRHLDKYRALYMAEGFDVLTVVVHVRDFLLPRSGSQRIAAQLLRFLRAHQHEYRAYVFQAFSVGAYQVGEVFVMLHKERNKELLAETKRRLKGLLYDSAMDLDEAPIGLSRATTDNALLQWGISTLMYAHLRLSYHISTRHYISSSEAVKANVMGAPTIVFMSEDDVVVNYRQQIRVIEKWRESSPGDDRIQYKCWKQSPHVSHFFKHREEYTELVHKFLAKVLVD